MSGSLGGARFVGLTALVALALALRVAPASAGHGRPSREVEATATPLAPPLAPGLADDAARAAAAEALATVVAVLPENDRQRLSGIYLVVDGAADAPSALAACDDDGDYVVVVNEALLTLVDFAAQLASDDEVFGGSGLSSYAELLLREVPMARSRVAVPPPGFFAAGHALPPAAHALEAERYVQGLEAIVAHEVAHAVRGDVRCAHPTATHEAGDDVWTAEEREGAARAALTTYTAASVSAADDLAVRLLLRLGQLLGRRPGSDPVLSATDVIEVVGAMVSPYARSHQGPTTEASPAARDARIEATRVSARRWRESETASEGDEAATGRAREHR